MRHRFGGAQGGIRRGWRREKRTLEARKRDRKRREAAGSAHD
jgi:hypothetical protein